MYILLNPEAGGGRALERWASIEAEVTRRTGPFDMDTAAGSLVIRACVERAMDRGETEFIAGGGDGTVNAVMSALVEHAPAMSVRSTTWTRSTGSVVASG
jgi:diacylglycerol kinase family enzyme